ncbi:GroES-like protein [Tilletiopsis washingtonensis]|uniref:GroES-like protein n=1 Tax=Tilletiopsis washingtonensis TaxID=58919 RepID=A0A316ZGI6_9BASI|nr:GroES-like protein [Tilletiopsis washingtonensis]PWO00881.1 GroES-like protein [Tilletiopsis washingtonensis]
MTDIPKQMRGLVIESFAKSAEEEKKPYTLRDDLEVPEMAPHHVLVKIAVAAVCHTDGMVVRGEFAHMAQGEPLPLIPSHEPTGVVVAVGSEAEKHYADLPGSAGQGPLKAGDRVGSLAFKNFCGKCEDCKAGNPKFCEQQDMSGVTSHGGLAQYMTADYRSVVRIPDALSFDAAAPLFCAGATVFTAVRDCKLKKGQSIVIYGAGALGHLGVQFAKCLGLRTIVIDSREPPLDLCKALKHAPDVAFNSKDVDVKKPETVKKALEAIGGPADAVVMCTDVIPAFELGLELTRKHGLFMVVGQPADKIPIHFEYLIFKDLTVKGSLLGEPAGVQEMLEIVAKEGIEVKTRSYPLEKIHDLLEDYGKPGHAGKLVVRVSDEQ